MTDERFERREKARLDAMYDAHYSDEPTYQTEYSDVDAKPVKKVPSKKVLSILVLAYYAIVAFVCVYFAWMALVAVKPQLPCSVSEISPDFSNADRERCRLMRNHKL
jgi:hypothetical protein